MPLSLEFAAAETRIVSRIYRNGPLTKQQLVDSEGLSWGTIVKFVTSLEERGILETRGTVDRPPQKGKNAYLYGFTGRYPRAIGVDVEYRSTSVIVTNLNREVLFERRLSTPDLDELPRIEAFLTDVIEGVVTEFGAPDSIMGVGIGIPGVGIPVLSVPNGGSNKALLIDRLQRNLGLPVEIALNTQAYTMFERWFRTGFTADDFVFVSIRSGVGSGIILDGQLYSGPFDLAGGFGHFTVVPDGKLCRCGKRGCLETLVNENALIEAYTAASGAVPTDLAEVLRLADDGEARARDLVGEAAGHLGAAIAHTLLVLNISRVIVSGHFGDSYRLFASELQRHVTAGILPGQVIELDVVNLDPQGFTQGAALLMFSRLLEEGK